MPAHHTKKPARSSAFTLVELLVVIAIISILAAMLLPALEEAKRSAHRVTCVAKLRNWGQLLANYAGDQSGMFPYRYPVDAQITRYGTAFVDAVEPYGVDISLSACSEPFYSKAHIESFYTGYGGTALWTYYYHPYYTPRTAPTNPWSPTRITHLQDQYGEASLLVACANRWNPYPTRSWGACHPDYDNPIFTDMAALGYPQYGIWYSPMGMNRCLIDGHVEWFDWMDVDSSKRASIGLFWP